MPAWKKIERKGIAVTAALCVILQPQRRATASQNATQCYGWLAVMCLYGTHRLFSPSLQPFALLPSVTWLVLGNFAGLWN